MKFRKKPVTIDAVQWTGDNLVDVSSMVAHELDTPSMFSLKAAVVRRDGSVLKINTLEGEMAAKVGDWIIKGVKGELYPCHDDIFKETYGPVED